MAIGLLVVNILNLFREVGLGAALIQKQEECEKNANAIFFMILFVSILTFLLTFLLSEKICVFFNSNISQSMINIFAFSIIITSTSKVHELMLQKKMMFKKQTVAEISSMIVYCVVTISFAYKGYGIWSLVFGYIFSELARSLAFIFTANWHPHFNFSYRIAKDMFHFGKHVFSSTVLLFIFHNLDQILIGKFLGNVQLGFYSLGYRISNLPAQNITKIIGRVTLPVYSQIQNDIEMFKKAYLKSFQLVGFFAIPLAMLFIFIAPNFFKIYYGNKWDQTIPILKILAVYGLFRSFGAVSGNVIIAIGKPKILVWISVVQLLIVIIPMYHFCKWLGVLGVAILFTISMISGVLIAIIYIKKILKLKWYEYFEIYWGSLISSFLSFILGGYLYNKLFLVDSISLFAINCSVIMILFLILNYLVNRKFLLEVCEAIGLKK